nr:unnamed protein product [Callosobruchus analis]
MTFKHKPSLDDHIVKRHPDFITSVSRKVHECTKCTYKTTSISDLSRHVLKLCQTAIRCIYCNETFTSKLILDDHIVRRHRDFIAPVARKVYECTKCTYKTIRAHHLKKHDIAKHLDIAGTRISNNCMYCNKTFLNKRSLDDHIIRTHPDFIASVSSKIHVCTNCTYKAVSTSQLKRHMVKHSDNRITIRYCNKTFLSKRSLDDHIIRTHPDFIASVSSQIHECTKCSYKTTLTKQLNIHMMKHPEGTFQCKYCNKTFVRKRSLDDHIVKIHPDFIASVSSKVQECSRCSYKTTITSSWKQHIRTGIHIIHRCIYCNKTFTCKQSLDDHIVKIHPDFIASVSGTVHKCTKCTYKTVSTTQLKRHITNNRITIECLYCNKTFTSKRSLDDHIVKAHPDFIASVSRKVQECSRCSYKTIHTCALKRHIVAKHPDIANKCVYCNKTFVYKRSLDDHIVKKHPDFIASVSGTVHKCTKCTYKTVSKSQLKRHMVKHHDLADKCTYCNKTFTTKESLEDHIVKAHPDFIAYVSRKVHKCTKCSYKTVQTSKLKRHMAKHPDVKIRCIYCNKTFTSKLSLDDHIVKKHPDFIVSVSRKVHECSRCTYKTILTSHLKGHNLAYNIIINRCIYCNKTFTSKLSLDDHIVKRHPDFIASVSRKVHECSRCTYKTIITSHLKGHNLAKHPSVSRKVHKCTKCSYKTVQTSKLKRHMAKHPDVASNRIIHK